MSEQFQLLADCPCGLVEGALVELYDQREPCCHLGVALEARCRLCGMCTQGVVEGEGALPTQAPHDLSQEKCPRCAAALRPEDRDTRRCPTCGLMARAQITAPHRVMTDLETLVAALGAWAAEEGCQDHRELLETSFGDLSPEEMLAQMQRGERVESSFDVLGFLFSHIGGGGAASGARASSGEEEGEAVLDPRAHWGYAPTSRIALPSGRAPNLRNRALALISVMAIDGEARERERRYINDYLKAEGLAPLEDGEVRVRRPHEVGPVGSLTDREALIEHMLTLAHIDDEQDESELRLIREFARHWGVDPARIDDWVARYEARHVSFTTRWLKKARALLLA